LRTRSIRRMVIEGLLSLVAVIVIAAGLAFLGRT
jgi:hypothetical protein